MITEEEALDRILAEVEQATPVRVALEEAHGRILREDVSARVAIPRFDNSAVDGFALSEADCGRSGVSLDVLGEQAAGRADSFKMTAGQAVRVFTGAVIPAGTAAVVMQEDTELSADGQSVRINDPAETGDFIRRRGEDVAEGTKIVSAGETLSPQKIALLAAQGIVQVPVGPLPRVSVLTTGDELVPAGCELSNAAAIYDSNGPMLVALLDRLGIRAVERTHTVDEPDTVRAAIENALADHDVLLIAGGVSVGARDYVKRALGELGISPLLWRVAVKPGMPLLFGRTGQKLIFGLPGNPVSAFVTCLVFAGPALRKWQGAGACETAVSWARLGHPLANKGARPHYLRGRVGANGIFQLTGRQESHALFSLSQANALLRVSANASLPAGELVQVLAI